jgi:hypothetical protein
LKDELIKCLEGIPRLPKFAVHAIAREIEAKVRQWLAVTKESARLAHDIPDIFLSQDIDDKAFDHLMQLIGRFGGCAIYVPHQVSSGHPLVVSLGEETAEWLCQQFGGGQILVPKLDCLLAAIRDRAVREDHQAGKSIREIADRHCITFRSVYRILSCDR